LSRYHCDRLVNQRFKMGVGVGVGVWVGADAGVRVGLGQVFFLALWNVCGAYDHDLTTGLGRGSFTRA
jgi:hypothetical protein